MQLTVSKLVCFEVGEGFHRPIFPQFRGIGVSGFLKMKKSNKKKTEKITFSLKSLFELTSVRRKCWVAFICRNAGYCIRYERMNSLNQE